MNHKLFKFPAFFVAFGLAGSAWAAPIAITNANFDDQDLADDTDAFTSNDLTGWTTVLAPNGFAYGAVDPGLGYKFDPTSGDNFAYIVNGSFSQDLTGITAGVGEIIRFNFDAGINNGTGNLTINFAGLGVQSIATSDPNGLSGSELRNFTVDFVVTSAISSGDSNTLVFGNTGAGSQVRIDTLSGEVVPEPTSLALLGLGGLLALRRRR